MEKRLQLLETLSMRGDDGRMYKVRAYEHLARLDMVGDDRWESTGLIEYKLDNGERVLVDKAGRMTLPTGVGLEPADTSDL